MFREVNADRRSETNERSTTDSETSSTRPGGLRGHHLKESGMKARAENRLEETFVSPDSAVQKRRTQESGLHSRNAALRTAALAALVDEAHEAIASTTSPRAMFDALVEIVGRALPLRALAVVNGDAPDGTLVWCADAREQSVADAEVAAMSTLVRFDDVRIRDPWRPLGGGVMGKLGWLAVPLFDEDRRAFGVLGVATRLETNDEPSVGFVVEIARHLAARLLDDEHACPVLSADDLVAELEEILLDGLDHHAALAEVARVLGTLAGTACVIDVLGTSPSRIVHALSLPEPAVLDVLSPLLDRAAARRAPLSMAHPLVTLAAQELGAGWLVVLPLRTRDDCMGALALLGTVERPLRLTPAQLDTLARHAAAAVRNGQLYEAALSAVRARDEILSTVSHDLKNPLSIILLSAARLLEDGADARIIGGRPAAEVIHRSARRMRRLVSDLLDVSALDGGALTMHPTHHDPRRMIADTIEGLAPAAAEAGVTLHDEVPPVLPPIFVDADRISQVLANLVGNAIKFTPSGGSVRVGARVIGELLEVSVSDTGIGIAANELPHVFDRFWRAKGTRKVGTGLGLAIAKSIVELSGGHIEAKSEPGIGTVVSFTVPLAQGLRVA